MAVLGPILAQCYAQQIGSVYLEKLVDASHDEGKRGDFKTLDIAHHLSSGFKAVFSYEMNKTLDQLR